MCRSASTSVCGTSTRAAASCSRRGTWRSSGWHWARRRATTSRAWSASIPPRPPTRSSAIWRRRGRASSASSPATRRRAWPTRPSPTTSASSGQSLLGDTLWLLGQPEEATRLADEAIAQARRCSPFTQSVALVNRMILATSMRDAATSRQRAQELIALSSEHSYQYLGRALAHLAGADRHLRGIGRRRDRSRAAGGRVGDRADADRLRQQPAEQPLPRLDGGGVPRSRPPRAGAAPPRRGRARSPPARASATGSSELHRLRARLLRAEGAPDDADRARPSTPPSTSPGPRARRPSSSAPSTTSASWRGPS